MVLVYHPYPSGGPGYYSVPGLQGCHTVRVALVNLGRAGPTYMHSGVRYQVEGIPTFNHVSSHLYIHIYQCIRIYPSLSLSLSLSLEASLLVAGRLTWPLYSGYHRHLLWTTSLQTNHLPHKNLHGGPQNTPHQNPTGPITRARRQTLRAPRP